jgi:hypothetical protein
MSDGRWEVEFRRKRLAQLRAAYEQSPDRADLEQVSRHRAVVQPKVLAFLDAFRANGDLDELRCLLDSWGRPPGLTWLQRSERR